MVVITFNMTGPLETQLHLPRPDTLFCTFYVNYVMVAILDQITKLFDVHNNRCFVTVVPGLIDFHFKTAEKH